MNDMDNSFLITTEIQRKWIEKFKVIRDTFKAKAEYNDQHSQFPYKNIEWLIKEGYGKLTLPKAYGGEGATIEDMVILQSFLGELDGATALFIGWHVSVVGQIYEQKLWSQDMLEQFAVEINNGALVNRAVSEAEMGSPTRGGRPSTHAVKADDGYILNGVKTYTSMSKALTHIIVAAYIEELESVGFFLVDRNLPGVEIADNWDVLGMRATESHDLILNDVKVPLKHLVETEKSKAPNGWILHIPSCYLGIAQAARNYAVDFAIQHSPNSIEGTIATLPTVQQNLGKMETLLLCARQFLWSTAKGYQQYKDDSQIRNPTSASKVMVMNQGLEVIDLAMRIVGAKSLEMNRPLQRYYRDMRAGLHNPPMEDAAYTNIAKSITDTF